MNLQEILPSVFPHYIELLGISIAQSLIASFIGTITFALFAILYYYKKHNDPHTYFVQIVDTLYEKVYELFSEIGWKAVSPIGITFAVTVFVYILWNNLIWLFGDMVVLVWPAWHHYFRPVTTDVMFNAILAVSAVLWSLWYGFYKHGFGFIKKYIPIHGMWITWKVTKRWMVFTKFLDIILGLLIWFIELAWELGRMVSLSLRLFWNMFVWMLLLTLTVYATQQFIHIPVLLPLPIFAYELAVSVLQAFIFALLTTIYFKLAGEAHH